MSAPGYPTVTYYPFVGWYYYRKGTSTALKKSRAHFFISWGIFDPTSGTFPTTLESGAFVFLDMTMQL